MRRIGIPESLYARLEAVANTRMVSPNLIAAKAVENILDSLESVQPL